MSTKVNFTSYGVQFKNIEINGDTYEKGVSYYTTGRGRNSLVKQYVKALYGVKCSVNTNSFRSINIDIKSEDIPADLHATAKADLKKVFSSGTYNAMEDYHDYKAVEIEKEHGIDCSVNFLQVSFV